MGMHDSRSNDTRVIIHYVVVAASYEKLSLVAQLVLDLLVLVHLQKLKCTDRISKIILKDNNNKSSLNRGYYNIHCLFL